MTDATKTPLYPTELDPTALGEPEPPSDMDRGPFVTLWTGRHWPFTCPIVADVHAADWHGLSFVPRFGGAAGPYSPMEHMVRGVEIAEALGLPERVCLAFGVHDIPESYPPHDLLGPFVSYLRAGEAQRADPDPTLWIRSMAEHAVWVKCGVLDVFRDPELFALVHKLDVAMCAAEKRDLVRGWAGKPVPEWAPKERIVPWGAAEVRERYYRMLAKYAPALAAEFAEGWL